MLSQNDVAALLGKRGLPAQLRAYGRYRHRCPPYLIEPVRAVRDAIAAVPDCTMRRALVLYYVKSRPIKSIGQSLGLSPYSVRTLLADGVMHMAEAATARYRATAAGRAAVTLEVRS